MERTGRTTWTGGRDHDLAGVMRQTAASRFARDDKGWNSVAETRPKTGTTLLLRGRAASGLLTSRTEGAAYRQEDSCLP